MAMTRTRSRGALLGLATVFALGGTLLGADHPIARAAEPDTIDLSIPADVDIPADVARILVDEPSPLPETIDADVLIDAAAAALEALPAEAWEVDELAASLGSAPDAAFELVRDSIGFDAYAGVLRGAEGTLASRSGNAWDRALLLRALLDAAGETTRLAEGELSAEAADRLLARTFLAPASPLPDLTGHGTGAVLAQAIAARARRDHAMLREALSGHGLPATGGESEVALQDVLRHAWVQVQREREWVDLDPSLPDALPGEPLTVATGMHDIVPGDARHVVVVRLIAETLTDGALSEAPVLERRLDPVMASDQQVMLYFGPESESGDGGLLGGGGAPDAFVPVLSVDGEVELGESFVIAGTASGGLLGGSSDVDLASLALEVSVEAPGSEPNSHRHMVMDRVTAGAREAGGLDRAALAPIAGDAEWPQYLLA